MTLSEPEPKKPPPNTNNAVSEAMCQPKNFAAAGLWAILSLKTGRIPMVLFDTYH